MIITKNGELREAVWSQDGEIYHKGQFAIVLYYTDEQKKQVQEMQECQKNLRDTDFKATKYSEGLYSEEEYAPIKLQRQQWRDRYNEIKDNYIPPSITEEEAEYAIEQFHKRYRR